MNVEPTKLIEVLSNRHAQKISQLEQEVSYLLVANEQLAKENEKLREGSDADKQQ